MTVLAVIPARLDATRLPRKPLAIIGDRPMIQMVHEATVASGVFDEVVVATDSAELAARVRDFGGRAEMTSSEHRSGTERCAEVAGRYDATVIANVQGDQPFVTTDALRVLIEPFKSAAPPAMSTVACPLSPAGRADPNTVKAVLRVDGSALLFTRAHIPTGEPDGDLPVFHHLGLYAFDAAFLAVYSTLSPTPLERHEGLEQLRVLEHGYQIHVGLIDAPLLEINTQGDLDAAQALVTT